MTVPVYSPVVPMLGGNTYVFPFALLSQADAKIFKSSPSAFQAGDFTLFRQLSGTWSLVGNLATTPTLISGSTRTLQMTILNTEIPSGTQAMAVLCSDVAGSEWCDLLIVKDVMNAAMIGTSDLTQANILSDAVPFSGAYIDAAITSRLASASYVAPLSSSATAAAVWDGFVEGTLTFKQAFRLMMSVLFGKSSGGGTANIKFRDMTDSKDRISATVDTSGNRTSVTKDGT